MATVFGKEECAFYTAFFIPDAAKRRVALERSGLLLSCFR